MIINDIDKNTVEYGSEGISSKDHVCLGCQLIFNGHYIYSHLNLEGQHGSQSPAFSILSDMTE